jgi:hypothetical protein
MDKVCDIEIIEEADAKHMSDKLFCLPKMKA